MGMMRARDASAGAAKTAENGPSEEPAQRGMNHAPGDDRAAMASVRDEGAAAAKRVHAYLGRERPAPQRGNARNGPGEPPGQRQTMTRMKATNKGSLPAVPSWFPKTELEYEPKTG